MYKIIAILLLFSSCSPETIGDNGMLVRESSAGYGVVYWWSTPVLGCSPVAVDRHCKAVVDAAAKINNQLECVAVLVSDDLIPDIEVQSPLDLPGSATRGRASLTYDLATGKMLLVDISIAEDVKGEELEHVAAHELGHALGLTHDRIQNSAMTQGSWSSEYTDHDIELLNKYYCSR